MGWGRRQNFLRGDITGGSIWKGNFLDYEEGYRFLDCIWAVAKVSCVENGSLGFSPFVDWFPLGILMTTFVAQTSIA